MPLQAQTQEHFRSMYRSSSRATFEQGWTLLTLYCRENLKKEDKTDFHDSIRKAVNCIRELSNSINYQMTTAGNLLSLNVFCIKELSGADLHCTEEGINNTELIMKKLYEACKEAGKHDDSAPIMNNSQTVYAGLTYGKESLVVNLGDTGNRGFTI